MRIFLKVLLFLNSLSIIGRIVVSVVAFLLFTNVFLPDLVFNFQVKNPKKFTIESIITANKAELPRYIILENAQPLASHQLVNEPSDSTGLTDENAEVDFGGYNYVVSQRVNKKRGDTTLSSIHFPVFSRKEVEINPGATIGDLVSYVVIEDANVTEKMLENDAYFKEPTFSIEGKFDGTPIGSEELDILRDAGFQISNDAILLKRGVTLLSFRSSLILSVLSALVLILFVVSFVPESLLAGFLSRFQDSGNRMS